MKNYILCLVLSLVAVSGASTAQPAIDLNDYELVFSDEFNAEIPGTVIDSDKWSTRLYWGPYVTINAEEQLYVDTLGVNSNHPYTPFSIDNGILTIEAIPTSQNFPAPEQPSSTDPIFANNPDLFHQENYDPAAVEYLSGILTTAETYNVTHGYFEARLKFPAGQGLWPAFWLLNTKYVENSPEIDIVEFLGHKRNTAHHTMHYIDQSDGYRTVSTPTYETQGPDYSADFHTYAVSWDPKSIRFFVDGELVREVTDEEFLISTQSMYLILNLAVGGNWPGSPDGFTEFPAKYQIDYVRAYERKSIPLITQQDLNTDYQLMFSDEFNGSELNSTVWNSAFLWGPYLQINNEEQVYIDKLGLHQNHPVNPFEVSNGTLKIKAAPIEVGELPELPNIADPVWQGYETYQRQTNYLESGGWTPEYSSGILTSYDSFKFVNGYAEARIRMPEGSGLWPAFWLLNGYYVGPSPEMDIVEVRGSEPFKTHHSYHFQNLVGELQSSAEIYDLPGSGVNEFHTYGFQWDRERMVWYVDGVPVREFVSSDVSYQLSYVILNLAVGGNFVEAVGGDVTPAEVEVDWVRVWQTKRPEELQKSDDPITSDTTDPVAVIVTPSTGLEIGPTDNYTVSGTYIDTDSEVDWVRVRVQRLGVSPAEYWNGSEWQIGTYWLEADLDGNSAWQISGVDFSEEGRYRLRVSARDVAGNTATAAETELADLTVITPITSDTTDPVAVIVTPSTGLEIGPTDNYTVSGTYIDTDSEVDWVRVRVQRLGVSPAEYWNGSEWQIGTYWLEADLDGSSAWQVTGVDFSEGGRYRLRISAKDVAGNIATAAETELVDMTVSN